MQSTLISELRPQRVGLPVYDGSGGRPQVGACTKDARAFRCAAYQEEGRQWHEFAQAATWPERAVYCQLAARDAYAAARWYLWAL